MGAIVPTEIRLRTSVASELEKALRDAGHGLSTVDPVTGRIGDLDNIAFVPESDYDPRDVVGLDFPVLDSGYVRVVDVMGGDFDVVDAARISYGKGTRKVREDRALIRYLMRHRHTSPFEMCEIKLGIQCPMDVWRQWIRHRTACLAEGTEIHFDLPGRIDKGQRGLYKLNIEDVYTKFQPTVNRCTRQQRYPYFKRDRVKGMMLRQANEDTLELRHTNIVDVFYSGRKPVYRVVLDDGKSIECTADHRFLFDDGWHTLADKTGLHRRKRLAVYRKGDYYIHVNGQPAYQDRGWLDMEYNGMNRTLSDIAHQCGVSPYTIRKWARIHGVQKPKGGNYQPAWNKGMKYHLGPRQVTDAWRKAHRRARRGRASNFWRGGVSSKVQRSRTWATQVAAKVHRRNKWTCQLCFERSDKLHCHHIVPVWADRSKAKDMSNLTTLCIPCHRRINGKELAYVDKLRERRMHPIRRRILEARRKPRKSPNKLETTKLVRIATIEYIGIKRTFDLEVAGPYHNFVANGIITHNSVNEYSTRYSEAIDTTMKTEPGQWRTQSASNKQGSDGFVDGASVGTTLSGRETELHEFSRRVYEERLSHGVAREQARKDLPLSTYTRAYWKIDLHNLLHFLELRMDPHAQLEIRKYAEVIGTRIVARWVPMVWEAFMDYRLGAVRLSRMEMDALRGILAVRDGQLIHQQNDYLKNLAEYGLTTREINDLAANLDSGKNGDGD